MDYVSSILHQMKSQRMRWQNWAWRTYVGNEKTKVSFRKIYWKRVLGRRSRRWEGDIKIVWIFAMVPIV